MNLTPILQQAVEQLASSQGISPEQFILQAITEKIATLKTVPHYESEAQLIEKDGLLVFETESLEHIDFDALIEQSRDRGWEELGL